MQFFLFFLSFLFFFFLFVRGKGNGEGKMGVIFLRGSSLAVYIDLKQQNWESGCGCAEEELPLWHSRPRCHGDLKQGPGASSPLTWLRRRLRVWSSAALRNPEWWRPGLRGLLCPGGLWESGSQSSPKSLSLRPL